MAPSSSWSIEALFQSTHPMRGATASVAWHGVAGEISIHAPREGCDCTILMTAPPTPPFQSTHPVRGATWISNDYCRCQSNFNPRTP